MAIVKEKNYSVTTVFNLCNTTCNQYFNLCNLISVYFLSREGTPAYTQTYIMTHWSCLLLGMFLTRLVSETVQLLGVPAGKSMFATM